MIATPHDAAGRQPPCEFDSALLLEDQGRRSMFLVVSVVVLTLALLVWAGVARVDTIIRGEGRIIPSGKAQHVQHLEGGIVRALLVREGDSVRAGQVLVEIDPTRAGATLAERTLKRDSLRARAARLEAIAKNQTGMLMPKGIDVDSAVVRSEIDAFESWRERIVQETKVLQQQVDQKRAHIESYRSREKSVSAELEVAKKQLALVQTMHTRRSASRMELLDAQARLRSYQTQVQEARAAVPQLSAAIAEIRERMNELHARDQAEARTELAQVRAELAGIDQEILGQTDRVTRTEVRAPVDGIVNRVYVNTIGGVVRSGEPLVELTPIDSQIMIEAFVRPADRANLRTGIPANARVSAFDSVRYGRLPGKVVEVSADTVPDEHGNRLYRVRIAVDSSASPIPATELVPGITASADFVTGHRTILDYLLSPLVRFGQYALREPQ